MLPRGRIVRLGLRQRHAASDATRPKQRDLLRGLARVPRTGADWRLTD